MANKNVPDVLVFIMASQGLEKPRANRIPKIQFQQ